MISEEKIILKNCVKIKLAILFFWDYCQLIAPDFYKKDRTHLQKLCHTLQSVYEKKPINGKVYRKLMINMPPQHGKTRTLFLFCQWVLGKNNQERIITASYNDNTATDFSKYTRNGIMEQKQDLKQIVYSDIFPGTKIKYGEQSQQKWALKGQHFSYIGTGVGGSVTSKGGTILILDDPVKGAIEAMNKSHLDKLWLWYTGTFISRVSAEGGEALQIVVHTRWSDDDISGRLLKENKGDWYVLTMEAYDSEKDTMLCPDLLNKKEYLSRKNIMLKDNITSIIFWANYHQKLIDVGDRLYKNFKTYIDIPKENGTPLNVEKRAYGDIADQGTDYLCVIFYEIIGSLIYIKDVYYTDEPAEITEIETAKRLKRNETNLAVFESNNGGRFFSRNVKEQCRKQGNHKTVVKWMSQSTNKIARIHANSHWIMENVLFPIDWASRWSSFYLALTTYQRKAKNKHDDAPDALTGIAQQHTEGKILKSAVI